MTTSPAPGAREQAATRLVLFMAGFGIAAWAPMVPFVKARAGLNEGELGLLLLCLGLGSIMAMPLSGVWARRSGCRIVIAVGVVVFALILPVLALSSSVPVLAAALFVFGAGIGSVDCVEAKLLVMVLVRVQTK